MEGTPPRAYIKFGNGTLSDLAFCTGNDDFDQPNVDKSDN